MTVSFDTLSFAKRLTEAGEKPAVAEAHAMALKEFVMDVIATKADLRDLGRSLGEEIQDVREDIANVRGEIGDVRGEMRSEFAKAHSEIGDVRSEVVNVRTEMRAEFAKIRGESQSEFAKVRGESQGEFAKVRGEIVSEVNGVRQELIAFRKEVGERFATKDELRHEIGLLRKDIDAMGLKLTVRMGGMLAVAVGAVATLSKLV